MIESRCADRGFDAVRSRRRLRILRATWILGIGLPLISILLQASPIGWLPSGLLSEAIMLLAWALNSVWAAVLAVRLGLSRRWPAALLISILPALLVASIVTMPLPLRVIVHAGSELHFLVWRQSYLDEVAQVPRNGEPKLVVFELGGLLLSSTLTIVYDESDELSLLADQRSSAWQARVWKNLYCRPDVQPFLRMGSLTQHFYLVAFNC